jgi:hypothetical protein
MEQSVDVGGGLPQLAQLARLVRVERGHCIGGKGRSYVKSGSLFAVM